MSVSGAWTWLADAPRHLTGIRVLQVAIGSMLLFRVFTEAPFASYLWGPNGIADQPIGIPYVGSIGPLFFASELGTLLVLASIGLAGAALVLGVRTGIAVPVALLGVVLLEQRLPELPDGGDNIARLTLIYMLFVLPASARPRAGSFRVWLHNLAVIAIALQLCALYATSGLMKAYGERWHSGTAMYYISQVEWFSLPGFRDLFKDPLITTLATYIPVAYQVLFPVAIISPLKLPWIFVGALFHAGIAVFMGLVTFSTVMVGLELFLISDGEYALIASRVGALIRLARPPIGRRLAPQLSLIPDRESTDAADDRLPVSTR